VRAGHSTGGIYVLLYAARYPEHVAGLALIDSATPYQFDLPDYPGFYSMWQRGSALLPSLSRTGLARVKLGRLRSAGLPLQAGRAARAFAASSRDLRADRVDFAQLPRLFDEAKAVKSLGGRPLAVVTASVGQRRGWGTAQDRLAKLSTKSVHGTVEGATHTALLEDKPFAAIRSRAIEQVVQRVRPGYR
jgi:pimeloyl-ACP methyl ester carboxylesterase